MVPPDVRGGMAHLGTGQLRLGLLLNQAKKKKAWFGSWFWTNGIHLQVRITPVMTVEDLSNWAQASIVFWFLTKCKHCWKAKNEHVLTSGVKSWFNSFIYHLCPPFGCSDPGFLWKWVKWFEAIWTDSIQQCIVGQLIHFWTPSDEGKLLVLWKTLKKKVKETSIYTSKKELRFCKCNRLPKIQSCRDDKIPQTINYVKSSLCTFSPCYVRKPYALFPRDSEKNNKKGKGKNDSRNYQNLIF